MSPKLQAACEAVEKAREVYSNSMAIACDATNGLMIAEQALRKAEKEEEEE